MPRLAQAAPRRALAVVIDGQPHVFPLNYAADDEGVIVFRTAELTAATEAALARVAFEVDDIDVERQQGWSVAVHGYGRSITGAIDPESERLRRLPLCSWAPGRHNQWFKPGFVRRDRQLSLV